jgi:hypothetical protein
MGAVPETQRRGFYQTYRSIGFSPYTGRNDTSSFHFHARQTETGNETLYKNPFP